MPPEPSSSAADGRPTEDRPWSAPAGPVDELPEERAVHDGPVAAAPPQEFGRRRRRAATRSFAAELPVLILIAFALALLLKTFLVQAFFIPSGSMEPTLAVGDRVLVNKVVYALREPERGDVIVFGEEPIAVADDVGTVQRLVRSLAAGLGLAAPPERDFIKRVIGLPGETIEQRDGQIYIDGEPLQEATVDEGGYLSARDPQNDFAPVVVPEGEFFVMGDNRPNSSDSRFSLGTISRDEVVGRAFVVIWPFDRLAALPQADYPGIPEQAGTGASQLAPVATAAAVAVEALDGFVPLADLLAGSAVQRPALASVS